MDNAITFEDYLREKKIDASAFKTSETDLFASLRVIFDAMNPVSFTAQKLFLINPLRRKYHLNQESETQTEAPKKSSRPKFKIPTKQ